MGLDPPRPASPANWKIRAIAPHRPQTPCAPGNSPFQRHHHDTWPRRLASWAAGCQTSASATRSEHLQALWNSKGRFSRDLLKSTSVADISESSRAPGWENDASFKEVLLILKPVKLTDSYWHIKHTMRLQPE